MRRALYRAIRGRWLEALGLLTHADRLLHEVLHWLVARARAQGKSWREISAATGTNARNEWQKHQRWLDRQDLRETDDAPDGDDETTR